MFNYLLLKSIFDLSDIDVVERSKYDMSFKYFLEMAPEDLVIDPSSLTKFRRLRLQDVGLLDLLIQKIVEIALDKKLIKSKTYSVTIKSNEHKDQEAFQNSGEFKEKAKSCYKIEAKNSELKNRHGYDVATSAGLFGMQIQGAMAIFAVNLKRIRTLMRESE